MKIRFFLFLIILAQLSLSQNPKPNILKKVYTDKSIYTYGETVNITIRAINTSSIEDTLIFPDLCEVYPYVDSTDYLITFSLGCFTAISGRPIKGNDSIEWKYQYPRGNKPDKILPIGTHNVFGYFRDDYPNTDTIGFVVKEGPSGVAKEMQNNNFHLNQNYPNPFNPSTKISFILARQSYVSLRIYNALGQELETIITKEMPSGLHIIEWTPKDISSGIYYYSIVTPNYTETKKLVFTK
jgi:hypothetical protein